MKTGIECFAGANTSEGFTSGFDGIFSSAKNTFFIKGAPGTGKSGLMKRICDRQRSLGHQVNIFHCSSDPDSLDAVTDETIGCAIMDATAPHAYDPPFPGAAGAILSLGDFLNERALMRDTDRIRRLNEEMKLAFSSASRYLESAKAIQRASLAGTDDQKADKTAKAILASIPSLPRPGRTRSFFLEACTHKGLIGYEECFSRDITVSVPSAFPFPSHEALFSVHRMSRHKGLNCILFKSPVDPLRIRHLYLPDVPLFITTREGAKAHTVYDDYEKNALCRPDDRTLYETMIQKACMAMGEAKRLHDDLESLYTPRMDFSRLVECEARVLKAFDEMKSY